ncbi:MAG: alpha-amylase family glycosyl hydrolase [Bacteroidota bacterium]
MITNPTLFEINTRVFVKRFGADAKLLDIPNEYWEDLVRKGIDYVWLMGIWKTCSSTIDKYCFEDGLVNNYKRALKDWKKEDVIGSPFAIDTYNVNPELGDEESLLKLKSRLNKLGMKLILDFIPNHFSADTKLLREKPEIFLSADEQSFKADPHTYYKPFENEEKYFAHGRDPFYPAWQDTVQINYCSKEAREYLVNIIKNLTSYCDGLRCDMAMLVLNNVFKNTWTGLLKKNHYQVFTTEFWKEAILRTREIQKDFLFIAEAYWDMEWDLQQLGFDYTYDKRLTDRLRLNRPGEIEDHLKAEYDYQIKSVRFLENHDEERAASIFGKEKSLAAAVIISTIPGMRFYYDGQFEGKRIKLPVQLGREPEEHTLNGINLFYEKLLKITSDEIFKKGKWELLEPISSWEGNYTHHNILAWEWNYNTSKRIVVINYSDSLSTCRLKLDTRGYPENVDITDLLDDQIYLRSSEEVFHTGLYVELKPWQSHIFHY